MSSGSNTKPFEATCSKLSKSNSVGRESSVADTNTVPSMSSFERMLDAKLATLATKTCINELKDVILEQKAKIDELEGKVVVMEKLIDNLEQRSDDLEQYQRRLCLRIVGVELKAGGQGESGQDCLKNVKGIFKELGVDVPDLVIDRAHRIGEVKEIEGKSYRQIIVRFTTWRHRTMVYRARRKSDKYKICLNLTRKNVKLLSKANDLLEEKSLGDCYAFSDVNCRLCLNLAGKFQYFESEEQLLKLVSSFVHVQQSDVESETEGEVDEHDEDSEAEELEENQ